MGSRCAGVSNARKESEPRYGVASLPLVDINRVKKLNFKRGKIKFFKKIFGRKRAVGAHYVREKSDSKKSDLEKTTRNNNAREKNAPRSEASGLQHDQTRSAEEGEKANHVGDGGEDHRTSQSRIELKFIEDDRNQHAKQRGGDDVDHNCE